MTDHPAALIADLQEEAALTDGTQELLMKAADSLAAQARRIEDLQVMLLSSDQRAEEVERELAEVKEPFDENPAPGGLAAKIAALSDKERAQRYLEVIRGQGLSMRATPEQRAITELVEIYFARGEKGEVWETIRIGPFSSHTILCAIKDILNGNLGHALPRISEAHQQLVERSKHKSGSSDR